MFWISIKDSCIMIPYFFFIFYTVLTVKYFYLNLPKQKCCCNMVTFKFSHWTLTSTVFHIPIVTLLKKNLLIVTIFVFINKLLYWHASIVLHEYFIFPAEYILSAFYGECIVYHTEVH